MLPLGGAAQSVIEECTNVLDQDLSYSRVSEIVVMPGGQRATVTCSRSKNGTITVTVKPEKRKEGE